MKPTLNQKAVDALVAWLPEVRTISPHSFGPKGFNAQFASGAERLAAEYNLCPKFPITKGKLSWMAHLKAANKILKTTQSS